MNRKNTTLAIATLMLSLGLTTMVSAAQPGDFGPNGRHMAGRPEKGRHGMMPRKPGVFGSVTAINGTSFTITSRGFGPNNTSTIYTIDATNATVDKNRASSTISNIAIGDNIMVEGTISNNSVMATAIHDNIFLPGQKPARDFHPTTSTIIQGNGQPVIGGNVSAINGTSVTVTNRGNVTYNVDVSAATVEKNDSAADISSIVVGDTVIIQGQVSGTSVAATSIIDQGTKLNNQVSNSSNKPELKRGFIGNVFNSIGGFFHNLFKF